MNVAVKWSELPDDIKAKILLDCQQTTPSFATNVSQFLGKTLLPILRLFGY